MCFYFYLFQKWKPLFDQVSLFIYVWRIVHLGLTFMKYQVGPVGATVQYHNTCSIITTTTISWPDPTFQFSRGNCAHNERFYFLWSSHLKYRKFTTKCQFNVCQQISYEIYPPPLSYSTSFKIKRKEKSNWPSTDLSYSI